MDLFVYYHDKSTQGEPMKIRKRVIKFSLPIITALFVLTGCLPGSMGGTRQQTFVTNPVFHPTKDLIAFVSNIDGDADIFLVRRNGSELKRLTDNQATDINPVWSPDGERIVFVSDRNGKFELFLMNEDGSAQTAIPIDMQSMAAAQPRQR